MLQETASNRSTAPDKRNEKPEGTTITINGDKKEDDKFHMESVRNYGKPEKVMYTLDDEIDSSIRSPSKNRAFYKPPSGDCEPQDTCSSDKKIHEKLQHEAEKDHEKENGPQEINLHWNNQAEGEVSTSRDTAPSSPKVSTRMPEERKVTEAVPTKADQTENLQHKAEADCDKENGVQGMSLNCSDQAEREVTMSQDTAPNVSKVSKSESPIPTHKVTDDQNLQEVDHENENSVQDDQAETISKDIAPSLPKVSTSEDPVPKQEECEVTEDVETENLQHRAEVVDPEKKIGTQEMSDQADKEVLTSKDTVPILPKVPENDETSSEEVPPKLTKRQKTSRDAIFDELRAQLESDSTEDEEHKETCCRKCTDNCCLQSYTCAFGNPFSTGGIITEEIPLLTETLRKGRAEGLRDFKKAIFPLISDFLRMIWVIFELTIIIVGLILSVLTFSIDQNRIFNIIHLVLIIISTLLALIDGIFIFKQKYCCKCTKTDPPKKEDKDKGCCEKCSDLFDIMRLILSEVLFYPLLICDIFELIIGRGFEGKSPGDIIGIVLFVISLLLMVLTVYVARIVVLIGMVKNATAVRTPDQKMIEKDEQQEEKVYDKEIKQSALRYQASFCIHVVLQMLYQLLMYIAIAAKIRYDNRHFYEVGNTDESIHVSGYLGFMIFAGFIMPACGLFTFFIVTYYWSQQYPIGYHIDMMSIFKMTEYGMIDVLDMEKVVQEKAEEMRKHIELKPLKKDFNELFNKSWLYKFLFPFKTPTLVIICLVYAVFQLAFVLCAAQTVNEMGEIVIQILNGGGWVIYYIVAVIVGVIANLYVFIVAGFWMAIFSLIIILFVIILACLILLCMLAEYRNKY